MKKRIAATMGGLVAMTLAQAQTDGEKELRSVVVGVSRAQTKLEDMPLSTTLLTREDIEKSPAASLDQLLKNVAGINLTDAPSFVQHPTGQSISMRGLGNARTLVLLDGIPLTDAFYGTVQWHKVPMSSIERVEVVKGAASSLWGSMAMGGVVNVITKAPEAGKGNLSASYGSFDTSKVAGDVGVALSDTAQVRFFADNFLTSGYVVVPETQRRSGSYRQGIENGMVARNRNVGATAYLQPGTDTRAQLRVGLHEMHEEHNGIDIAPNDQWSADVAGSLVKKLSADSEIQAAAWYQDTKFETISPANANATYIQNLYDNPYSDFGASLVWSGSLKEQSSEIQIGADYRRVSGSNRTTVYSNAAGTISSVLFGKGTHQFVGAFGQWKWMPRDIPLDVTASARVDYWKNDGDTSNQPYAGGVPNGAPTIASFGTSKRNFDPSVALRYLANDNVTLRAAAYRAFHAPGLNNMYRTYGSSSVTFSNPSLMPETMRGGEIGLDFRNGGFDSKLTMFRNRVTDLVTTYTLAATDPLQNTLCGGAPGAVGSVCPNGSDGKNKYYKNAGKAVIKGVEAEAQYVFTPAFSVNANAVYTSAQLTETTTSDPVGLQLQRIPRRTASLGATWHASPQWRLYGEVRGVSEFWDDNLHAYRIPGYSTVNLTVTYRYSRETELHGSIVNLFDRTYVATGGVPPQQLGMPFAVFAGVRTKF